MATTTQDPIVAAREERDRVIDEAKERADRGFIDAVRDALKPNGIEKPPSMVEVARRAGMTRENIYRLMKIYPEEVS